jgi:hypothetical protein
VDKPANAQAVYRLLVYSFHHFQSLLFNSLEFSEQFRLSLKELTLRLVRVHKRRIVFHKRAMHAG